MICDTCGKYPCDMDGTKLWHHCFAYSPKPKLITNADKVRAMSDEELARLLGGLSARAYDWVDSTEEEVKKWLEWLHKEAEE